MMVRKLFIVVLSLFTITGCQLESHRDSFTALDATRTPYGRYEKKVTYKIAHLTGYNNSYMPSGDTYENNAYTRYLLKKLNVQNKDIFEGYGDHYSEYVSHVILSKKLPDVMIVESLDDLEYLVENDLIEDLTTAYKQCASSRIKDMYASYDSSILDNVTFNGKIYAMPETNIDDGPNFFWVRDDWRKELNLQEPQTLDDVENIVRAFMKYKGADGLMADTSLTAGTGFSSEYLLNLYFAANNTYPKQWIERNGTYQYDSINEGAKTTLSHLHDLYKEGVLDKNFLLRTSNDIAGEIINGKCGAIFGPWWVPNNPLVDAIKKDSSAKWKPYLIKTNGDSTTYHSVNPSSKFVVVRKGYKHPEVIFKIISVIFDYLRYDHKNVEDVNRYYEINVDPTARPIAINVDYQDALKRSYYNISKILNGASSKNIMAIDVPYATACKNYLAKKKENSAENWAAYASRIEALGLLEKNNVVKVKSGYFSTTATMNKKMWKLKELESDAYLQIISGSKPVSYFDDFVKQWKEEGGDTITQEVNNEIRNKEKASET